MKVKFPFTCLHAWRVTLVTLSFALLPPVWGHAGRPVFVYCHLALQQRGGRALCAQRVHVSTEQPACGTPHPPLLSQRTLHMQLFVLAERAWSSGSSSFSPPSASWGKLPITWLSGRHQKWCATRCTYTHICRASLPTPPPFIAFCCCDVGLLFPAFYTLCQQTRGRAHRRAHTRAKKAAMSPPCLFQFWTLLFIL